MASVISEVSQRLVHPRELAELLALYPVDPEDEDMVEAALDCWRTHAARHTGLSESEYLGWSDSQFTDWVDRRVSFGPDAARWVGDSYGLR